MTLTAIPTYPIPSWDAGVNLKYTKVIKDHRPRPKLNATDLCFNGVTCMETGHFDVAIEVFQHILRNHPQCLAAQTYLDFCKKRVNPMTIMFPRPQDPEALYTIGQMFKRGLGVEKSMLEAEIWFKKATDLGYVPTQCKDVIVL